MYFGLIKNQTYDLWGPLSDKIMDYLPTYSRSGVKNLFLWVLCLLDAGTIEAAYGRNCVCLYALAYAGNGDIWLRNTLKLLKTPAVLFVNTLAGLSTSEFTIKQKTAERL